MYLNNPMQTIQQFLQFRKSFSGDAKSEVMKLLQNGRMSQSQLNELQTMATQFQNMMKQSGIKF